MDPSAEGKVYEPTRFEVTSERIDAFRDLFGGPPGIPLTLLTAAEFLVFPRIIGDPDLGIDLRRVVHGSQEYEFCRPLRVGEVLTVGARITSIRQKGGTGFLAVEMTFRDAEDEVAAVARSTMLERGAVG